MNMIKEDKLGTILLDFNNELNEEYLKTFGYKVGQLLKAMTTGKHAPVSVKGEPEKVKSFAKVLGNEIRYIDALLNSSIDNPETMKLRHELEAAIAAFEKSTGIKWPVR
tara:strand:- start:1722 stop:2048 length:327 start_codon:yes stop_codon:yes gene_type:complete